MFGKVQHFLQDFQKMSGTGMKVLTTLFEPVGYGMEVVQKPSPVTEYFYKGLYTRTPGEGKHFVRILQIFRTPVWEACRTHETLGYR